MDSTIVRLFEHASWEEYPRYVSVPVLLLSHWVFQGAAYMDRTERWFKLSLDVVITAPLYARLRRRRGPLAALCLSAAIAHTLNFAFNGHVISILTHFGILEVDRRTILDYMDRLRRRAGRFRSVRSVVVIGSLSRGEFGRTSDLDVRVVREPGRLNGVGASLFVMAERTYALVNVLPIDVFLLDDASGIDDIRPAERDNLVVLYDPDGLFG